MFGVVGCGNNNVVENNDVENVGTNDVVNTNPKQEEIVDDYYVPSTENLVGVGLYPVDDRNNYPYDCGEKVTNFAEWKFIYQVGENTYAYDDNIVSRAEGYGWYVSDKNYYWGYVYCENGNYYIVATHDYCDLGDDIKDYRSTGEGMVALYGCVIETVPNAYTFEYSWFDYLTTEVRDSVTYKDNECPTRIVLPDKKIYNKLCVKYMYNEEKVEEVTPFLAEISYNSVINENGSISWAFDGYNNGESYQYYIDIVHPDFQ